MKILRILTLLMSIALIFPLISDSTDKNSYYFNGEKLEVIWRQSCDQNLTDYVKIFSVDRKEKLMIIQRHDDLRSLVVRNKVSTKNQTYHITNPDGKIITLGAKEFMEELINFAPNVALFILDREKSDCVIYVLNALE